MSQEAKNIKLMIVRVEIDHERIKAEISDERIISIPIKRFPKLMKASSTELNHFEISSSGYGIHWPTLDEDISIRAFI